jgi:hypothetical protein
VLELLEQVGFLVGARRYKTEGILEFSAKNALRKRSGNYVAFSEYGFTGRTI